MLRQLQSKNISLFQNVNMARFAELSESELYTILEEKDAENTKKATKVTLNIFRGYLQEKGLREAELLTSKVKLANACMSNYIILFLNRYYTLTTHKNLLY